MKFLKPFLLSAFVALQLLGHGAVAQTADGETPSSSPASKAWNYQYNPGSSAWDRVYYTITPVASTALESGHVLKASAGTLYSLVATTTTAAGYLMVFNSTTVPADGAVTPLYAIVVDVGNSVNLTAQLAGMYFPTGVSVAFSTTGPFTKTASATAMFSWQVR